MKLIQFFFPQKCNFLYFRPITVQALGTEDATLEFSVFKLIYNLIALNIERYISIIAPIYHKTKVRTTSPWHINATIHYALFGAGADPRRMGEHAASCKIDQRKMARYQFLWVVTPIGMRSVNWPVIWYSIHQNNNNLWHSEGHSLMIMRLVMSICACRFDDLRFHHAVSKSASLRQY